MTEAETLAHIGLFLMGIGVLLGGVGLLVAATTYAKNRQG